MTNEAATEAITAYFTTAWGTTTPLTRENEAFKPPVDAAAWARLSIRHGDQSQRSLGPVAARRFDRRGFIFVQLFTATDKGRGAADRLVTAVRAILEATRFGGVVTFESSVRELGTDGRWFQMNVETGFRYEQTL